tara:strand:- start:174115 stop:174588 length:474 start_codon:yes stop_codon:yes gene_type:complete
MDLTCTHTSSEDIATGSALDDTGIIPFADDGPKNAPAPVLGQQPERAQSEAQDDTQLERASIADRELGIERNKWERRGKYACPCCGHGSSRVVRVRVPSHARWSAVCAVCAAMLLAKMPGTIVGGMVRPTRRRGTRSAGQTAHGFRRVGQVGYRQAG